MRHLACVLLVLGACSKSEPAPPPVKAPEPQPAPAAKPAEPQAPVAEAPIEEERAPETLLDIPEGSAYDTTVANAASSKISADDSDEMRIYTQVRRRLSAVNLCYAKQRKLDPTLAGKLTVMITVAPAPKGTVTTAQITE